jgi:hypothetical protein
MNAQTPNARAGRTYRKGVATRLAALDEKLSAVADQQARIAELLKTAIVLRAVQPAPPEPPK